MPTIKSLHEDLVPRCTTFASRVEGMHTSNRELLLTVAQNKMRAAAMIILSRASDRTVYGDGRTFDGRILAYPYRMPSRRHKFLGLDGTVRHKNGRIREDGA